MKIIFIFIDGFGIGANDTETNPVFAANAPNIRKILENGIVFHTDATLSVKGLPQSATGQTAIFTGVNAAEVLGRHLHGQPTITLKKIINEKNLFIELKKMGLSVTNANAYRKAYLDNMVAGSDRRERPSVTSVMTLSSDTGFRTIEDYNNGRGIYHDITGKILVENGFSDKEITPQEAARRLYSISREYDFTLFEHFMTDIMGHRADFETAKKHIEMLDLFLGEMIASVDTNREIIFITSDHGNIEDMSVKTHTYNKVPSLIWGKVPGMKNKNNGTEPIKIESLTDIEPAIINIFKAGLTEKDNSLLGAMQ